MNWKIKAKVQNTVALLPASFSYAVYYWLQRSFGNLRGVNPVDRLAAATEICRRIAKQAESPVGKVFLEIGTGRRINMPIAFWLMGAEKVISVDSNPYLKQELVSEDVSWISSNQGEIRRLLGDFLQQERWQLFADFASKRFRLPDLMQLCNIEYIAPGDAAQLPVASDSVDFHVSYTVLEHIPPKTLESIFVEGNRVVKKEGLFIHRIDYSDHFSHSDRSISPINFLQYNDEQWKKLAGNRYMYMNRLRVDDLEELIQDCGQEILEIDSDTDARIADLIRDRHLILDEKFKDKPLAALSTTASWITSRRSGV